MEIGRSVLYNFKIFNPGPFFTNGPGFCLLRRNLQEDASLAYGREYYFHAWILTTGIAEQLAPVL